jgi:lysophospholipase L1-like esterase
MGHHNLRTRLLALTTVALLACLPAAARAASCASTHWIGAWGDAPSDASGGDALADLLDASESLKLPVANATIRAILTPTYGGSEIRVHLSNRFGATPVTFGAVTIALEAAGAGLAGPAATVTFAGSRSVTIAPGQDVVSDPVQFSFQAFQTLAVSLYVPGFVAKPTEHYTARQISYVTPPDGGNHASDVSGAAFSVQTTSRYYVDGLDVLAPASAGAVVAFGDSITDGYQTSSSTGVPETTSTLNTNGNWPDDLARRLTATQIPLSILNEGISGNRILQNGAVGGGFDTFGPSALSRLQDDVIDQAGVTTVIWLEGINDLGTAPYATAAQIEAGYVQGIDELQRAHLRVLLGTLTPSGGADGNYGTGATNTVRQQINDWIRAQHIAYGYIDFDAAVRNATDTAINPAYDDGDHLHLNLAGYQAMADTIRLTLLRRAACTLPALHVVVGRRTVPAGTRVTLHIRVTGRGIDGVPAAGVRIDGHRIRANTAGHATITLRFARSGRYRIRATANGYTDGSAVIRVTRRA